MCVCACVRVCVCACVFFFVVVCFFVCFFLYCFLASGEYDKVKEARVKKLVNDAFDWMGQAVRDDKKSLDVAEREKSSQVNLEEMTSDDLVASMSASMSANEDVLSSLQYNCDQISGIPAAYRFGRDLNYLLALCKNNPTLKELPLPPKWVTEYKPVGRGNEWGKGKKIKIKCYGDINNALKAAAVLGRGVSGNHHLSYGCKLIHLPMRFAQIIKDMHAEKFVIGFAATTSWCLLSDYVYGSWLITELTDIAEQSPELKYCTPLETSSSGSGSGSGSGSSSSSSGSGSSSSGGGSSSGSRSGGGSSSGSGSGSE